MAKTFFVFTFTVFVNLMKTFWLQRFHPPEIKVPRALHNANLALLLPKKNAYVMAEIHSMVA